MSEKKAAWVTLKPGLKVFRLWESIGPKQPEIAILWLSGAQYKEFAGDQKQFLNENHIFPKAVNKIVAKSELGPDKEHEDSDWLAVIEHDPAVSDVEIASMPMF